MNGESLRQATGSSDVLVTSSHAPIVALDHRHDVDTDSRFSLLTSVVPVTLLA
jgi:hypothetical protein